MRIQNLITIILPMILSMVIGAQLNAQPDESVQDSLAPEEQLPVDPKVTIGEFDNGVRYYIRENSKPENRAEIRLVINAGSVLENHDQQGLAHFTEHMAFNGTKHFEKQELVDYLESIGMRFGPDINAYTSFDETVYMLQLPTDSTQVMKTGFQVLEDWARHLTFAGEEIDKERGVVIEEWRLGRGAQARMREEQYPVLFHGSRYAERLPIGKKAVIDTFDYETLRNFYSTWYRPELMGVIAVGDFDSEWIQSQIRDHFAGVPADPDAEERKVYPLPNHEKTLFAIASDPEATRSSVSVYYKHDVQDINTVQGYRQLILESLYNQMFNDRLKERSQEADPPFLYGYSAKGRFIRSAELYFLGAGVKEGGIERGLEALLTEAKRVQRHGFTQSELERNKKALFRSMEQAYRERGKTKSEKFASEYIRAYLYNEPIPGIEYEYQLYRRFLPEIALQDVNRLAEEWITEENRVILADSPEKEGLDIPTEEDLRAVLDSVRSRDVEPYREELLDEPLMQEKLSPADIVSQRRFDSLDVTEWELSNGIKVVLKPTNFKNDEVRFTAFSPGGRSLVPDSNIVAARTAADIVSQSGIGAFTQIQLEKKLADKVVNVSPYIHSLTEGFSGSASPQDLETLFQLIHLYFTSPREDSSAYLSYREQLTGYLQNRGASPEAAYRDTIQVTMNQYHPRYKPWTVESLEEMDLKRSLRIYRERFADAGDFTFIFVGNFQPDSLQPLVSRYLGDLPDTPRQESWRDVTYDYPDGVIEKSLQRGKAPKSLNSIIYSGDFQWSPENRFNIEALADVLRIILRERIREDLGGTYGVSVRSEESHYPRERYKFTVQFGCNPDRVEELTSAIFTQIDSLRDYGTTEENHQKVKEIARREYEQNLQENGYWVNALQSRYFHDMDPETILRYDKQIEGLTLDDLQEAAREYLDQENYVRVVLYPEDFRQAGKIEDE